MSQVANAADDFIECVPATAMDFPIDDSAVHVLGRCRLCTVQHIDCGLIW